MNYSWVDSPIGPIFLAAEDRVVHEISFSTGHQVRSPRPGWVRDDAALAFARTQLEEYFTGERRSFDLELAMNGTEFQKSVWTALLEIPYGEVRSYGEIARSLGREKAFRAVGAANGANHLPLVVPCHRVVGSDGSLTGFGGGLPTKQWLLDFERQPALF